MGEGPPLSVPKYGEATCSVTGCSCGGGGDDDDDDGGGGVESSGGLDCSAGSGVGETVKSGLEVLVNGGDICHDALPVGPLRVHHLIYVLEHRKGR